MNKVCMFEDCDIGLHVKPYYLFSELTQNVMFNPSYGTKFIGVVCAV